MDHNYILLVDDETEICEKLAASFELEDFKVVTASSGNEAVEVLRKNPEINFIVSDVKMANGDGVFLLNYIKKNLDKDMKIVMLSGYSSLLEEDFVKMGAIALKSKPTNIEGLIDFVKSQI